MVSESECLKRLVNKILLQLRWFLIVFAFKHERGSNPVVNNRLTEIFNGDFLGGPVAKTPCFEYKRCEFGFNPWLEN